MKTGNPIIRLISSSVAPALCRRDEKHADRAAWLHEFPADSPKSGGTFVEVMMACVVLSVIAITGAAFVAKSSGTLAVHRNRAVAVAMANSQMEYWRSQPYASLTNRMGGVSPYSISTNNSLTRLQNSAVSDLDVWSTLTITVQVTNRATDIVNLKTIYAP